MNTNQLVNSNSQAIQTPLFKLVNTEEGVVGCLWVPAKHRQYASYQTWRTKHVFDNVIDLEEGNWVCFWGTMFEYDYLLRKYPHWSNAVNERSIRFMGNLIYNMVCAN